MARGMAQSSSPFEGTVHDASGQPLYGANVVLYADGGKLLAFAVVGRDGHFSLKRLPGADHLTVSFMGYKSVTLPVAGFRDGQDIVLAEAAFQLREVVAKPERISQRGDTLTYSVANFKQAQDRSIADVIAKMPGLEVKPNGSIEYQGKAINTFYIEGLDLMGGQYAVASNNIPADKVQDVQVLEHHQKVKSLRGVSFSEQAALNIVLKEDARSVWTGLADLGAGVAGRGEGVTYDNRLMGMQFNKHFQTVMMYKNNNTGTDIGHEVQDIADLGGYQAEAGLISLMELGGPDFSAQRYTFNSSHLLAGNWLWKTGRDADLRIQASGFLDREEQRSGSSLTYLTIDGMPVITEDYSLTNRRKELKGEVCYTLNADRTYLRSSTRVYADWDSGAGTMHCNDRDVPLSVKPYKRMVSEDLSLSHTTARGDVWQLYSSTGCTFLPGQLLTIDGQTQLLDLNLFSTRNEAAFSKKLGRHFLKNTAGFDYRRQSVNGIVWQLAQPYWEPSTQLRFGKHRLEGGVKVSYVRQAYEGSTAGRVWAEPSLRWEWQLSPQSEWSFNYRLSATPREGTSLVAGPLFTSYRNQYAGSGQMGERFSHILLGSYQYRHPVTGLFFNLRPMYVRSSGNILYESTLDNSVYVQQATTRTYRSDSYSISTRLAKTFFWGRTTVGLNGSFHSAGYAFLSSGQVMEGRVDGYAVSLDYSLRPLKWLSVEGKSEATVTCRKDLSDASIPVSRVVDWSHYGNFHILPAAGWMLSWDNELYHSSEKSFGLNYFCNVSLSYRTKRWELSLLANNVAGTSEYRRRVVSSTLQSYTLTYLRPREFLLKFSIDL